MRGPNNIARILTYFSQFTINMLVPIFLCCFGGYALDKKLGTNCFFVILFFVGAAAGARNIYILAKKTYDKKEDEEDR